MSRQNLRSLKKLLNRTYILEDTVQDIFSEFCINCC